MSKQNFMLSWVEHDFYITSGPGFTIISNLSRLTHFILETPKGVLVKSADPDQMPHNVASDLGLHYFASCSTIFQQKYLN